LLKREEEEASAGNYTSRTIDGKLIDPSASPNPVINTTGNNLAFPVLPVLCPVHFLLRNNLTISSEEGSVTIKAQDSCLCYA
jgi:hypothetical protein